MQTLELKIPPPIVALLVGAAMWAVAHLVPAVEFAGDWRLLIAGVCAGLGVIVSILGVWAFRQAKTTVNPVAPEKASSLVSDGIYSYTRNPMYVGLRLYSWLGPSGFQFPGCFLVLSRSCST